MKQNKGPQEGTFKFNTLVRDTDTYELLVLQQLGGRTVHRQTINAFWKWDQVVKRYADKVVCSNRGISFGEMDSGSYQQQLLVSLGEGQFLYFRGSTITAISDDLDLTQQLIERVSLEHALVVEKPRFFLIQESFSMTVREVFLGKPCVNGEEDMALHYGEDIVPWDRKVKEHLAEDRSGLMILRGAPGTGKTSYIRHLIHSQLKTHRFYYLPVTLHHALSAPCFVDFWAKQNKLSRKHRKVVILEDADELLMSRSSAARTGIANLLNTADGLLGEFLEIQLICTINCPENSLDPAVMRSGRLTAYREFKRLEADKAKRLADQIGRTLLPQDDYSLAEIYNQSVAGIDDVKVGRQIGFGG
ncbi:MAG: AAA family ATPase [Verrucomicrobiota bacterium]